MQTLELSTEELEVLREVLQHEFSQLDVEVFRTDTHDFKEMLKRRRDILDGVLRKLSGAGVSASAAALSST